MSTSAIKITRPSLTFWFITIVAGAFSFYFIEYVVIKEIMQDSLLTDFVFKLFNIFSSNADFYLKLKIPFSVSPA